MYTVLRTQYPILDPKKTHFHLTRDIHHTEGTVVAKTRDTGEKKVSQKAMVQAALEHCGWEAKPSVMQGYIKDTFDGTELAPNIISNYKSQLKREGRLPGGTRTRKTGGSSLQVDDFKMIRTLVSRLGADQVKELVDVVG
jgi:hypothetical protein